MQIQHVQQASAQAAPAAHGSTLCCRWVADFSLPMQAELLRLMNLIIQREDTIGFPEPLQWDRGMGLMRQTADAVASGAQHLLLFYNELNEVVGQLLYTRSALPNCVHIAEISRAFLHPDFRRPGLIRKGMRATIEKSEEIGVEVLKLDVRADTRIAALWQALGYEVIGRMKDYARVNGKSYTGLFMSQHVAVLKQRMERFKDR